MPFAWALLRRAAGGGRRPARTAGAALWWHAPVAILVGLAVLAVGPCASADAAELEWQLGYSEVGDHPAHVTAFEVQAAPVPGLSRAPILYLQFRAKLPGARDSAQSRVRLAARDRSPPVR